MDHGKIASKMVEQALTANIQAPSVDTPPAGINPDALGIWKEVLTKYSNVIFGSPSSKAWDVAIGIFERACSYKSLKPWK